MSRKRWSAWPGSCPTELEATLATQASGPFSRFLFSIGGPMKKVDWVKPVLVRKPVSATAQGAGSNTDGIGGEFPIQS